MLVCFVSAGPRGRNIAIEIAETAEANDELTSGYVIFSALIDDPASVRDTVDAFFGDIMLEAASAADTVSAGSLYIDAVNEAVTGADTQDGTIVGGAMARQAMVAGPTPVFVNSNSSRQAYIDSVMINQ